MRYALALLVAGTAVLAISARAAWADLPAVAPGPVVSPGDPESQAVLAVAQAPDPSSAIDAYAAGVVQFPNSVALRETYIRRMITLGAPDLAYAQADWLLLHYPQHVLAGALAAYRSAQQGDMSQAFTRLLSVAANGPNEPFVQEVAGQLLAWYDLSANDASITPDMQAQAQRIRTLVGDRQTYRDAYYRASQALAAARSTATTTAAPPPTTTVVTQPSTVVLAPPPPPVYVETASPPVFLWDACPLFFNVSFAFGDYGHYCPTFVARPGYVERHEHFVPYDRDEHHEHADYQRWESRERSHSDRRSFAAPGGVLRYDGAVHPDGLHRADGFIRPESIRPSPAVPLPQISRPVSGNLRLSNPRP